MLPMCWQHETYSKLAISSPPPASWTTNSVYLIAFRVRHQLGRSLSVFRSWLLAATPTEPHRYTHARWMRSCKLPAFRPTRRLWQTTQTANGMTSKLHAYKHKHNGCFPFQYMRGRLCLPSRTRFSSSILFRALCSNNKLLLYPFILIQMGRRRRTNKKKMFMNFVHSTGKLYSILLVWRRLLCFVWIFFRSFRWCDTEKAQIHIYALADIINLLSTAVAQNIESHCTNGSENGRALKWAIIINKLTKWQ